MPLEPAQTSAQLAAQASVQIGEKALRSAEKTVGSAARASTSPETDPRIYFAAERTFLAWIRTGLGLIGVGFAVSRFSLFLREFGIRQGATGVHASSLPRGSGIALVVLGVLVNLGATATHVRLIRELHTGTWQPGRLSAQAVTLALLLAAGGIAMAVYLELVR